MLAIHVIQYFFAPTPSPRAFGHAWGTSKSLIKNSAHRNGDRWVIYWTPLAFPHAVRKMVNEGPRIWREKVISFNYFLLVKKGYRRWDSKALFWTLRQISSANNSFLFQYPPIGWQEFFFIFDWNSPVICWIGRFHLYDNKTIITASNFLLEMPAFCYFDEGGRWADAGTILCSSPIRFDFPSAVILMQFSIARRSQWQNCPGLCP